VLDKPLTSQERPGLARDVCPLRGAAADPANCRWRAQFWFHPASGSAPSLPWPRRGGRISVVDSEILEPAGLPGAAASWQLCCPVCGAPEVEQGLQSGGDHTAVTIQPDRDRYDSPIGTRGGYVSIALECGAGHEFYLVTANHKGAEYIALVLQWRPG
jgi:hypothetical protein